MPYSLSNDEGEWRRTKNTPTSVCGCCRDIDPKILSQSGRPYCVGAFCKHGQQTLLAPILILQPIIIRSESTHKVCNRILLSPNIVHHDVRHHVRADLGSKVDGDLYPAVYVLFFNGREEGAEPFGGGDGAEDPDEVDFCQSEEEARKGRI